MTFYAEKVLQDATKLLHSNFGDVVWSGESGSLFMKQSNFSYKTLDSKTYTVSFETLSSTSKYDAQCLKCWSECVEELNLCWSDEQKNILDTSAWVCVYESSIHDLKIMMQNID